MSGGISASSPSPLSRIISSNSRTPTSYANSVSRPAPSTLTSSSSSYGAVSVKFNSRSRFICNSSNSPGDNDSKRVLDAFFLGKALAEALNERIESAVGEFLSTVGRLQAEQQKQVLDFQDEVLERAKKAKEKAAREALEAEKGITSKSPTADITTFNNSRVSTSQTAPVSTPSSSSPSNSNVVNTNKDVKSTDSDPMVGISIDD